MSNWEKNRLLLSTILTGVMFGSVVTAPSLAQDASQEAEEEEEEEAEEVDPDDTIVVTGSRIRRDSFTSTAPLQVIDSEEIRDAGLIDTAQILQQTTVAQGVQLDTTITSTFVTDGGPGANNISLRGLNPDQTLVLINGRRFAPAGVEGAPALPDVNLIPSSLIQRIDILLDGASSVYGSDAVAGVVNVILRDEFDGLQVDGFVSVPEESGGGSQRWNVMMGDSNERSNFVFAVEYFNQDELEVQDRDYNFDPNDGFYCSRDLEYDADGNLLSECEGAIINRIRIFSAFQDGNLDFSLFDPALFSVDVYRNGAEDRPLLVGTGFGRGSSFDERARSSYLEGGDDMIPQSQRYSMFFTGERDLDPVFGIEGITAFAEASHSNSQTYVKNSYHGQIFATVPASNPFNPFGVDVVPIFASPVERLNIDVEVQQTRLIGGLRGDLAFANAPEWTYELFTGYTRSMGYSSRPAIDEARLRHTIYTSRDDGTGNIICGTDQDAELFGFLGPDECVPVNLFHPGLYPYDAQTNVGFGSVEEREYLEIERTVTTKVDQKIAGGFVTGPVFQLPAGDLSAVVGVEWREDSLDSGVDTVAAQGRAAGFFADRLSRGSVSLWEVYGEVSIPVVSGQPLAEEITIDLAGRLTDHEFYGQNDTYSARASWSPTDYLTFRGTYGTSFRAPNTRELFLGGQTGFTSGAADPCVVPLAANVGGTYDPSQDNRDPQVLANCVAEGVDPTSLGLGGVPSIESFQAGNPNLEPETSTAFSYGLVFEQPFFDAFDATFGLTYFDIEVEDSIAIPGTAFSLAQCYSSPNFPNDPFCARRQRDPQTGFLAFVDNTPFNVATQSATGLDLNGRFSYDVPESFFGGFNIDVNAVWTWSDEVLSQTTPQSNVNNFVGDWGNPEWRGTVNTRFTKGDWSVLWRARYLGEQAEIFNDLTPGSNQPYGQRFYAPCELAGCVSNNDPSTPWLDYSSVITSADAVWYQDLSMTYSHDTWIIRAGVNNLFDEEPALVDQNSGSTGDPGFAAQGNSNAVLGSGYDLLGRRFFLNVTKQF
ncbi:TonB-dependent receptor domain-containing protein [Marinicauda algicola]|uniref:TonB-dependent receptor domain-containing protein n=1 Tax=Marinicauda algicola TaxID=2029849 RepID=UPI0013051ABA|nr:TonB-dependent receptor [Marinicauda algicola]